MKYKVFVGIGLFFVALFVGFSIYDFTLYNESYSAPFSAYILVRFLMFGVPAIIVFLVAYLLKKKGK